MKTKRDVENLIKRFIKDTDTRLGGMLSEHLSKFKVEKGDEEFKVDSELLEIRHRLPIELWDWDSVFTLVERKVNEEINFPLNYRSFLLDK